ncbi:protein NLRC5 isoform X2 [Myripristis murdjan]|uniref:protein NLRC5 isoform X2 n=1 Tax=Myripristis murdjan TaxID=586833 RepID=UPI0011763876|nr:protein NLRC5 isoform X2 [Myripristis murdjan]
MENEVDPDEEDVHSVLAQESTQLSHILSCQSPSVIMKLCDMMPGRAQGHADPLALTSSAAAVQECIKVMLEYYRMGNTAVCQSFLQSVCMLCENIPMHLESRLMSVAGYATNAIERGGPSFTVETSSSSPSQEQASKRPRLDYWEHYNTEVKGALLRRWERLRNRLVKEVQLEDVWVSPRHANRGRERPDQTPWPGDRGSRTPDLYGDYGSVEARVTLDSFLQGSAGQVTVLLGKAGSGKTLLMSCLGRHWAQGLGPIPSSYLFILLEFRQLNLLSHRLSLSELLFQYFLPLPGDDEKRMVLDYLLSNPEQSCWVLDGYDEFHSKITRTETQGNRELLDPQMLLPIEELISGLLSRWILPGCTLIVTCRLRDFVDLEEMADNVGELMGWEHHDVKEYIESYFGVKGHATSKAVGEQAVDLLLSSRHLLDMSSLPALCNICCVCLEYLLLGERRDQYRQRQEENGSKRREEMRGRGEREAQHGDSTNVQEGSAGRSEERKQEQGGGGHEDVTSPRANGGAEAVQIPLTLTQVYLTVLGAFLSQGPWTGDDRGGRATDDEARSTAPLQSTLLMTLRRCRSVVDELSLLAWRGLEESKILFMEQDFSPDVLEFSVRTGLLLQVELRHEERVPAYCFAHLTIQEFLAALRIITSDDVTEAQLKRRFNLKTRWTTKSDRKTVFTDSLHIYLCGLASSQCTKSLAVLAKGCVGPRALKWVQKRQALVVKLLKNLSGSNTLTGLKVLQLCHCVQETQDCQLAKEVMGTRPILELRNIRLLPSDIDALAFVVGSVGDTGVGLDFGACSMDAECLDVLSNCQYIYYLSFRSRKYNDKFAEKLSSILPKVTTLRKLEFSGASLTDLGAAKLASALQNCPNITEINLSDNNLTDQGIKFVAEIFDKLPSLASVMLGGKHSSLEGVNYLIEKMTSCVNIQQVHADGMKEINVTFSQSSETSSHKNNSGPTVSLLNQSWNKAKMQRLRQSLSCCPSLSVLDLSGSQWDVGTLRSLVEFLPMLNITKKLIVDNSCLSVEGLMVLTTLLSICPDVMELNIRLQSPDTVSVIFSGGTDQLKQEITKTLCLSCCGLSSTDLSTVWKGLGPSSDLLTLLDLSSNYLGNKGLKKLLGLLSNLSNIQEINVSKNNINMEGVVMLAGTLCCHHNLAEVHISDGGKEKVILKFFTHKSDEEQQHKRFRVTHSSILPSELTKLCRKLIQCPSHLELDCSHSSLDDKSIENLLKVLPKMTSLQRLNLSNNNLTQHRLLDVASTFCTCDRVSAVEVSLGVEQKSLIDFGQDGSRDKTLSIRDSNLESEHLIRLAEIISRCPSLTNLQLSNNLIQSQWVEDMMKLLSSDHRKCCVSINEDWIKSEAAVSLVCRCLDLSSNIHTIRVYQTTLHMSLMKSAELTAISFVDCAVEGCHLAAMSSITQRCPLLTELDLSHNRLGTEGAEFLCSVLPLLPNLTTLSISLKETDARGSADVVVQLSEALMQCPSIQRLNLSGHVISDRGAEILARTFESLPCLRSINLSRCRGWTVSGQLHLVRALGQCCSLEELCLDLVALDEDSRMCLAHGLCKTKSICKLNLNKVATVTGPSEAKGMPDLLAAMEGHPHMEAIELQGWRMADTGVEQLTRLFPAWTDLRKISLSENLIDDQSGAKLLEALRSCNQLRELHLSRNRLGDVTACKMALVLPALTYLAVLDISENNLGHEGSVSLSKALVYMKNLTKINLTSVGTSELCAVAASLAHCHLLQDVSLGWNSCGDDVAVQLAKVLPLCQRLTTLDLESNRVSVSGAEALVQALRSCPAVQLIRLWRNSISNRDAPSLTMKDRRLSFSPT